MSNSNIRPLLDRSSLVVMRIVTLHAASKLRDLVVMATPDSPEGLILIRPTANEAARLAADGYKHEHVRVPIEALRDFMANPNRGYRSRDVEIWIEKGLAHFNIWATSKVEIRRAYSKEEIETAEGLLVVVQAELAVLLNAHAPVEVVEKTDGAQAQQDQQPSGEGRRNGRHRGGRGRNRSQGEPSHRPVQGERRETQTQGNDGQRREERRETPKPPVPGGATLADKFAVRGGTIVEKPATDAPIAPALTPKTDRVEATGGAPEAPADAAPAATAPEAPAPEPATTAPSEPTPKKGGEGKKGGKNGGRGRNLSAAEIEQQEILGK